MKKLSWFINRLPFAGKVWIRPLMLRLYQSTTWKERQICYAHVMLLLIFFIVAHGIQAWMAISFLGFEAPLWAKIFSVVIATCFILAMYAQIVLLCRATVFFHKGRECRTAKGVRLYQPRDLVFIGLVSWGGMIAYIVMYLHYE